VHSPNRLGLPCARFVGKSGSFGLLRVHYAAREQARLRVPVSLRQAGVPFQARSRAGRPCPIRAASAMTSGTSDISTAAKPAAARPNH
jgi:hypothetical protein